MASRCQSKYEREAQAEGYALVAGVDEVAFVHEPFGQYPGVAG